MTLSAGCTTLTWFTTLAWLAWLARLTCWCGIRVISVGVFCLRAWSTTARGRCWCWHIVCAGLFQNLVDQCGL